MKKVHHLGHLRSGQDSSQGIKNQRHMGVCGEGKKSLDLAASFATQITSGRLVSQVP